MKKVIDLTQSIVEGGYNNPAFDDGKVEICMDYATHDWHAEVYTAATHVGTHTDAPMHKIDGGKPLSAYPVTRYFGKAVFVDLRHLKERALIGRADLENTEINEGDFVVLYTGWDRYRTEETKDKYLNESPGLGPDGAKYLVEKKAGVAMIDHFSVGGTGETCAETHEILMNADILITEGLKIPQEVLEEKDWNIVIAPMLLDDCSGAPTRVFVYKD